jgi:hypothetical protein
VTPYHGNSDVVYRNQASGLSNLWMLFTMQKEAQEGADWLQHQQPDIAQKFKGQSGLIQGPGLEQGLGVREMLHKGLQGWAHYKSLQHFLQGQRS